MSVSEIRLDHLQMEFWETYYFANLIHNVIEDPSPFLRGLEDFFGDLQYRKFLRSFPKYSALHLFIEFILDSVIDESIDDIEVDSVVQSDAHRLWVNRAMERFGIAHTQLRKWIAGEGIDLADLEENDIHNYHAHLEEDGSMHSLRERMVEEVFFLMFSNRVFLRDFNDMISRYITDAEDDDPEHFRSSGVLKRRAIPAWARRAVFYRDRGSCGKCNRDISGLVSLRSQKHFDHIIPLARSGINDVTNIQLLCSECNLKKRGAGSNTSAKYERWY